MAEKRPVSYQETLGTKTEKIQKETRTQNQNDRPKGNSLDQANANFPE
ncbi:hypothetical protein [Neobacillus terrae]|nr:hypothetical protein [Neobacillus terrae]NHM33805.1 hypothetical protein [Neobacillus terrae]